MTSKITPLPVLITMFFLICPLWAQAQENGGRRYVIEHRYVQTIEWIGDDYTLKYEVVIEKNEDGEYTAYSREFTEKPRLRVSLPSGKYRYRIIPYDYLEHPGEASDWVNIEIEPASAAANETDNPINLYVSLSWSPLFSLYGRMEEIFGNKFYPVGASVRFGALYNKLQWFSPGIELSTAWYALNIAQENDEIGIQTGVTSFNIVALKKLPNPKMAVTLRAGFALGFQVGEINIEDYSYTTGGLIPQINAEASFLWFMYKRLYLEAGVGFSHLIEKDSNSGYLRPWLGAGWQF